jgi:hypothetical protein
MKRNTDWNQTILVANAAVQPNVCDHLTQLDLPPGLYFGGSLI